MPGLQRDSVRVRGDGWREDVHDGGGAGQPGHHGARPARSLRRRRGEQQKGDETPRLLETTVLLVWRMTLNYSTVWTVSIDTVKLTIGLLVSHAKNISYFKKNNYDVLTPIKVWN